jgi:hypothetical protein
MVPTSIRLVISRYGNFSKSSKLWLNSYKEIGLWKYLGVLKMVYLILTKFTVVYYYKNKTQKTQDLVYSYDRLSNFCPTRFMTFL